VVGVARTAVATLSNADAAIAVHFDVDAVDSRDLPLADFPHYGTGVPLAAAGQVLEILLAAPGASALILTEINPTHDPVGNQLARYVSTLTRAIARGLIGDVDRPRSADPRDTRPDATAAGPLPDR